MIYLQMTDVCRILKSGFVLGLVEFELLLEGGVGSGGRSFLPHVVVGLLVGNVQFFHQIGDD